MADVLRVCIENVCAYPLDLYVEYMELILNAIKGYGNAIIESIQNMRQTSKKDIEDVMFQAKLAIDEMRSYCHRLWSGKCTYLDYNKFCNRIESFSGRIVLNPYHDNINNILFKNCEGNENVMFDYLGKEISIQLINRT